MGSECRGLRLGYFACVLNILRCLLVSVKLWSSFGDLPGGSLSLQLKEKKDGVGGGRSVLGERKKEGRLRCQVSLTLLRRSMETLLKRPSPCTKFPKVSCGCVSSPSASCKPGPGW